MAEHNGRFVAYYRVSTKRQGKSGLGLEAQEAAVKAYLNGGSWQIVDRLVEVESGRKTKRGRKVERPEFDKALAACRLHRATLIIAKLDRLARNVHFVSSLMESGVEFVCVDNPHANKLTIHILAAMAEHESEMISERTKLALAAAKKRGKVLGGNRGVIPGRKMQEASRKAIQERVAQRAADIGPTIQKLQAAGATSLRAIAAALNEKGIPTARGNGEWTATQVMRVMRQLG